jgi:putative ABC transport system substrate-binding protein
VQARTPSELEAVFAQLGQERPDALVIGIDPFFTSSSEQLAGLALRHRLPAAYVYREFAAAGGLMSYGGSYSETHRLVGIYAGRILKGDRPADLPVQQVTKVELVLNLRTAKALGLTVPLPLLGRADEVIE